MPKEEKTKVSELSKELVGDFRNLSASERTVSWQVGAVLPSQEED